MSYNVKKYIVVPGDKERWLVIGKTREYFITNNSCSCKSFQLIVSRRENTICKHLEEMKLAKVSNEYDTYVISIPEYQNLRRYLLQLKI